MFYNFNLMFQGILVIVLSFVFSYLINKFIIILTNKYNFNQIQREELVSNKKSLTPIFGGFSFLLPTLLSLLIVNYKVYLNDDLLILILISLGFFIVGFIDDYLKVFKHSYKGLNALIRTLIELGLIFAFIYYFYIYKSNLLGFSLPHNKHLYLGSLMFIIFPLIMFGGSNAINLTDGMDGLLSYIYLFSLLPLIFYALKINNVPFILYLFSLYSSLTAFLRFNAYPAHIFMGDTGSLYLGCNYILLCFILKIEFILLISGFIYILEALSVILQVTSFNLFHKRIFKMSPLHHHFTLCGVKEYKVVFIFITFALILLSFSLVLLM